MGSKQNIVLLPLAVNDASKLSAFLRAQSPVYMQYFNPFAFDEATISGILNDARRDIFQGVFRDGELIGMMMIRGWDAGFDIPSLGLIIGEDYRGKDLMRICVDAMKEICREHGSSRVMYKSHPANPPAPGAARMGFRQIGVDPQTGYLIFHCEIA
ncbi:MAG: GNAT family N-acetyltransferase [Pyrinomonadaceae bacterium MAG19_C2-C3]|nr:GNAT family N-acetyltransferase [Pyrinomonadaceae bacterium MAG19_C2-C3]